MPHHPTDSGPIYTETIMTGFPVEPFSTYSNLAFLAVILYVAIATRLDLKRYTLAVACLPLLTVGWIGGTLFHACRDRNLWLIMDVAPIGILALAGGIALWTRALRSLLWGSCALVACVVLPRVLARILFTDRQLIISSGYAGLALGVLLGAVLAARKQKYLGIDLLVLSGFSFAAAISFRVLDRKIDPAWMPSGTHWIWHIAGATSVYFVMRYLIESDRSTFTSCAESRT